MNTTNKVYEFDLPNREVLEVEKLENGLFYMRTISYGAYRVRRITKSLQNAVEKICPRKEEGRKYPNRRVRFKIANLQLTWRLVKELGLDPARVLRGEED